MIPCDAFLLVALLSLSSASAQTLPGDPPTNASESDKAPDAVAPDPPASDVSTSETDAVSAAPTSKFSLDTPIADLIADRRAKAVIDKHLPGMSSDKNLGKFSAMSLRLLQPQSGGRLTGALMEQVGADLAAID